MRKYVETFMRYRFLLYNLIGRDFKVKYRRSALGVLWSVLNPLLMMIVIYSVFSKIFRFQVENYPVYLLSGQLMFGFFSEATQNAMGAVVSSGSLIKKVYVPKYIFPLEKVMFSLVNTAFSFIALFIVSLITKLPFTFTMLLSPVPLLLLFVFNVGVGILLASAVVFFRDIVHLYGVLVVALNYLTPVFYDMAILSPTMQALMRYNPLYWYATTLRQVFLYGEVFTVEQLLYCTGFAVLALVAGLLLFRRAQDKFILYI